MDSADGLTSDFIHPSDINWALKSDAELWHAGQDGIAEAKAEMARRDALSAGKGRRFKRPSQ